MTLLQKLYAKQKADRLKAQIRLEKRRGYARAGRERARARALAEGGLQDLPIETQVAIGAAETPAVAAEPADASVEDLVTRLTAIRERIWRLQSVFAVSLSQETAIEANKYLVLFQALAEQLKAKAPAELGRLVSGHESLLLSPPVPVKQTIPLDVQRFCEIRWEASQSPMRRPPKRDADNVGDGLGWML